MVVGSVVVVGAVVLVLVLWEGVVKGVVWFGMAWRGRL